MRRKEIDLQQDRQHTSRRSLGGTDARQCVDFIGRRSRRHDLHDGRRRPGQRDLADPVALRSFGAGIVAGDTGITLHNRGSGFNLHAPDIPIRSARTSGRSTRSCRR